MHGKLDLGQERWGETGAGCEAIAGRGGLRAAGARKKGSGGPARPCALRAALRARGGRWQQIFISQEEEEDYDDEEEPAPSPFSHFCRLSRRGSPYPSDGYGAGREPAPLGGGSRRNKVSFVCTSPLGLPYSLRTYICVAVNKLP